MSDYYLFNGNPVTLAYPSGGVFPYIGSTAPVGYVLCDGASYNRFTYAELFNIIGYTYGGSGDNFNVPDYRDRSLYGGASGSWGTSWNNASSSYNRTITMPTHTHNFSSNQFSFDNNSVTGQASGTSFSHQHLYPWYYDARTTNTNQAKYINSDLLVWGRVTSQAISGSFTPEAHYISNSANLANDSFNPIFYESTSTNSNALDSSTLWKASANADGSTVSATGGGTGGAPTPTYNFDFRQVSSTSITDSIGGLTATYYGGMSSTVSDGASADGIDDYIQLQSFEFGGTFSIEIYFQYTANPPGWTRVFETANSGTADNTTFGLTEYINTSYLSAYSFGATYGANNELTSATISTNVWRHMVITLNYQTLKVYQDGSLINTFTTNSQTVGIRDTFYLFTNEPSGTKMQGNIKFFRYWHGTELTSTDVTTLYDNRENTGDIFPSVINTAPHETRVNYIMNYGALSNIEDVVHIYSTDNSNYTEYTASDGVTYAMFDMNSNDSYFYMEWGSSVSDDYKNYLSGNFGAQLLIVGGGGAGGGTSTYLGGGGGAGALGISTSFNLPAEKTIYGKIGKGGVNGTSYSETHETTSQTYTGEEGHGADTILYIDGAMVGYAQGGGSGQDDTSDTSARWGGCAGGYSGTYTAQGSSNLSLSGAESSSATNVLSISTYGIISFQGNTNGAASNGYWSSYPSFWWRGGTGGGGADSAGVSHAGPYDQSIMGANGTNGGGAYTWIDGLEYAGGGGGGGNGIGGGGGAGDGGEVASSVASEPDFTNSSADGQNATIANRGSGGGGGFTGGSGSDGVIKIAIPRDYILSVTQIPLGGLQIFTTHSSSPGLSWSGADNNTVRTYNGISYTFFYFTDAQAETTTGTSGGGQGNQSNKFFIGTDPTLTPQQTAALNKIHGVEMLLLGAGGNGGYCGHRRGNSNPQACGGGGGGAGGMGILQNGNLPTNQYIKFLIGQQGDTSGKYASNSAYQSRGYYEASDSTESNRVDRRARHSYMQVGTTESNVSTIATANMGGAGAGAYATYGQYSGGYYQSGWISGGSGYQDGASSGGCTASAGAVGSGTGGADNTNGTYGTWNFYANSGGSSDTSDSYGFGEVGGGGGAGGAGGSANGIGGNGKAWIDGNTYCTGGGGTAGSNFRNQDTSRNGGSSNIHSNESAKITWTGEISWVNQTDGDPGPSNSGSGGGGRRPYEQSTSGYSNMDGAASGQGGSGLAVIAIPTSLIGNIYDYDTYNVIPTGFLEIKYTGYDANVTESTTTYNGVGYTIFELTDTTYTQYLSIGFKSGIKALEKYAILAGGFDIPILSVGGGSSGAALSGTTAVGDGGSGGSVVNGNFTWEPTLTTTNTFEFACNIGSGGAASTSTRNAGGDTTIDLSGGYGLERYIDASGGEVDGSVGQATIKTLTYYGSDTINISSSLTKNSDYAAGTASGSAVGGAGGAGAGGAGSSNSSTTGGVGGIGTLWPVEGNSYGSGGGGAGSSGGGSGGNLIGGTGADANASGVSEDTAATSGTVNRGCGGGGGVITGAAGTAGVVKFAVPTSYINSIGMHENTLQTSNYLKVQTSSGSPTSVEYPSGSGVYYYLFDFQTDDNLTDKNHYFKITWADDASTATRIANAGNYGSASNLMLMVGGGGAGGDGGMPHDTNDDPENWRLLVGGGGGAGGMGEVYDADIQIDELVSITVGGGGEGGLDSSSKFVCNKGSDSIIYYTSTEVARAKGGGVGNFPHDGNYNGGSGGGKTGGFTRQNIENVYGSTIAAYNGSNGYNNTKTTDSIGTSISTYGNWTFYGNEGFENEGNDSNNWIAYYGGSGGGSAYEVGKSGGVSYGSYGGAARQWAVDGSYYAAGGGGVVHPSTSHLENVTRRGNGGGIPGDNKETRAYADIYGGSGKLAVYYSYNKYGQNTELAWYFTGYPTKHQTGTYAGISTSDYINLFQNVLQWDGKSGTGSGGGGGVDWDVEALATQEEPTNSDLTYQNGYMYLYPSSTGLNPRFIDNGYAGSGGSGRVKIAIPKLINGVTLIPVANIETGYTGT